MHKVPFNPEVSVSEYRKGFNLRPPRLCLRVSFKSQSIETCAYKNRQYPTFRNTYTYRTRHSDLKRLFTLKSPNLNKILQPKFQPFNQNTNPMIQLFRRSSPHKTTFLIGLNFFLITPTARSAELALRYNVSLNCQLNELFAENLNYI